MTYGSLFSGIGGLDLGVEMATGARCLWQAESDPYARAVLAKHWPSVKRYEDVREIDEKAERPDIICGGFPCQDISNAGKKVGISGARSGLWSEFARIIGVLRPRYVLIENVAALLVRGLDRVLADLAALGFDAEWDCFRASDVGAPHRRERIFILADAAEFAKRKPTDETDAIAKSGRARVEPRGRGVFGVGVGNANSERLEELRVAVAVETELRRIECAGHRFPPGPNGIEDWDGPEPAIRRGVNGVPGRVDRLRCLGNAVVPQQAAEAFRALMPEDAP